MFGAKLKQKSPYGDRAERASILVPFLIIAVGVGVLAWRSYQLSLRMKEGANALAVQYAGYAAEIAASRVDAAARGELTRAADEWQHVERRVPEPTFKSLQEWINSNDWIVSAIYIPDIDPANSVYVTEVPDSAAKTERLTREFYSPTGTVQYTFDPARLVDRVQTAAHRRPLVSAGGGRAVQPQADISIVRTPRRAGLERLKDGFAFTSPLAPPLARYAVRAVVRISYVGSGWENQALVSLLLSLLAIALTGLGAYLTWRGLRREAETMGLRAALIANISHELRTPLSMIRLGAETLRRGKLSDSERTQIEEQILREVLHLSHLVENVLDVARMQRRRVKALAFTPVSPEELVVSLVETYESWIRSRGFEISLDIDDAIDDQLWDREAVSRSLLNLIDNAMKYSGDEKWIRVCLRQDDEHVIIEVTDRGLGIEAKDLTRIFDPYYRARFSDTQTRRGAGLGLTLVQQIVASHGGEVQVESQPGAGSTFRLIFPKSAADLAVQERDLAEAEETL